MEERESEREREGLCVTYDVFGPSYRGDAVWLARSASAVQLAATHSTEPGTE